MQSKVKQKKKANNKKEKGKKSSVNSCVMFGTKVYC